MKKLLLIGLILAICVLAFPQGVLAITEPPGTKTAEVQATIASYLDLKVTPDEGINNWVLSSDAKPNGFVNLYSSQHTDKKPLSLTVETNAAWSVSASDLESGKVALAKGHMAAVALSPYLEEPLLISIKGGTFDKFDAALVINWDTIIGTNTFSRDLKQTVYNTDAMTPYHIVITFTASNPA